MAERFMGIHLEWLGNVEIDAIDEICPNKVKIFNVYVLSGSGFVLD